MDDEVIDLMRDLGIPITKSNYLDFAYMGDKPPSGAEVEANLPTIFSEPGIMSNHF